MFTLIRDRAPSRCAALLLILSSPSPLYAGNLIQALTLAEQSDPTYREAQETALAVAEGIPQAQAILWKPEIELTTGGSHARQQIETDFAFGNGGGVVFQNYDYRLNLTQPVYHHDRYIRLQQANKRLQQAQAELDSAFQALILRVAERYFEVLAAADTVTFAAAEKESLAGQLEQAKQRFEVGLIAITDVQEAHAGYDRALAQEIGATNERENAQEALREVTGVYDSELVPLGAEFTLNRPDPDNIETWTETALTQNLEILAAQFATLIAQDDIRAEYAGHYPTVDITGSHGFASQGGRFGQTDIDGSDVGIRMNIPLYAGGSIASRTRQATHEHAAALERLEKARRAVHRETRESYLGISAQISAVQALKQAVVSSKTAVDSTRAGFEVGTRTTVDVVTAERGLSEARRDFARARYDYVLDVLRLKRAAGTLSPTDLATANTWLAPEPAVATAKTTTP
ncbi:MAG: type I secretion protein TolC [Gammaproteobacteria bacterium]|nr:type I secretion protein TolC [Gammaproteobacteria bacterium]